MNLQQVKDKIMKSCELLEKTGIDISSLEVDFFTEKIGTSKNINITYNLHEGDNGKVRITTK